jgi:hypothetical protein
MASIALASQPISLESNILYATRAHKLISNSINIREIAFSSQANSDNHYDIYLLIYYLVHDSIPLIDRSYAPQSRKIVFELFPLLYWIFSRCSIR